MSRGTGLVRVAAVTPRLALADCRANAAETVAGLRKLDGVAADVVVFPEMGMTGYTCHDLYHDPTLQRAALDALGAVVAATADCAAALVAVGLPVAVGGKLFNCAALISGGRLLGVVPKTYLPNYKEFYDARYFASSRDTRETSVDIHGESVPFGTDLLFHIAGTDVRVGVEVCEDLWAPVPPSSYQALAGATLLLNLSASNELVGKADYRRQLVASQSARCIAAYIYAGAGVGESTTDVVFGGHCLVAENGTTLVESKRFEPAGHAVVCDIDTDRLARERMVTTSFLPSDAPRQYRIIATRNIAQSGKSPELMRAVAAHPFVPSDPATLAARCDEIFATQVVALERRLTAVGPAVPLAIGVSGGLDSTLALLVLCKTLDRMGQSRARIRALTMPGFGTSARTRGNADALMAGLGLAAKTIDIRPAALEQMRALGHRPFGIDLTGASLESLSELLRKLPAELRHDLTFENIQARLRTSYLMNTGFVVGTGDLSELALGWCTYNADHMSMYNVNVSIPKTLVKFLVQTAAEREFTGAVRDTLLDIVATEIKPELLPAGEDGVGPTTESVVGPYELHDFFLYYVLRYGTPPDRILLYARHAEFSRAYTPGELKHWLGVFYTRFFANQFKRSCLPDGPKVGSVSVSPRGDWRMPSDASAAEWLRAVEGAD